MKVTGRDDTAGYGGGHGGTARIVAVSKGASLKGGSADTYSSFKASNTPDVLAGVATSMGDLSSGRKAVPGRSGAPLTSQTSVRVSAASADGQLSTAAKVMRAQGQVRDLLDCFPLFSGS